MQVETQIKIKSNPNIANNKLTKTYKKLSDDGFPKNIITNKIVIRKAYFPNLSEYQNK